MLDDNMFSCKWGFNWCNALLSYSFHQNINKMTQNIWHVALSKNEN